VPNRLLSLVVGGLLLAVPAVAHAADVTIRVEGKSATLVAPTALTTGSGRVVKDGNAAHSCSDRSPAGVLEAATAGRWTGTWFDGLGYAIDSIMGEAHSFGDTGSFWTTYLNDKYSNEGPCNVDLQTGDEVLFYPTCSGATSGCYAGEPLDIKAPARITPGVPFTVTVRETTTSFDSNFNGTSSVGPSIGATVTGGASPATADNTGTATVVVYQAGPVTLRATKGDRVPDQVGTCATDGTDGLCGTGPTDVPCVHDGNDGRCGTPDHRAALGRLRIPNGKTYGHGKGPRTLSGTVADDVSGIKDIRIRITRNDRGRCAAYDGKRERFVPTRTCRAKNARFFSVGDRADWSYLLPERLKRGRYVLDLLTVDRAGNVDRLQRGRSRAVFRVA
jgi:hypothetical protein